MFFMLTAHVRTGGCYLQHSPKDVEHLCCVIDDRCWNSKFNDTVDKNAKQKMSFTPLTSLIKLNSYRLTGKVSCEDNF